jgi:flagellar protein FlaJ
MALFKKKPKFIQVGNERIELQPKPARIGLFGARPPKQNPAPPKAAPPQPGQGIPPSRPQPQSPAPKLQPQQPQAKPQKPARPGFAFKLPSFPKKRPTGFPSGPQQPPQAGSPQAQRPHPQFAKPSAWKNYVQGIGVKNAKLEEALRDQGIKSSLFEFVQRMLIAAIMIAGIIGIVGFMLFMRLGFPVITTLVISLALVVAVFQASLHSFLNFPLAKKKSNAKQIERDLLFASRDMIISLRSGMPLFNAITSVSTGYGEASKEFAKIAKKVQLGMPLEEAIDDTVAQTSSPSFRRIMLQASVSIKAGADVVSALQSIIDQVSQERIIELRRYGQKLNALAMFYMLFGIILPSMGVAVVTILTTFISFFTVDTTVLEAVVVGILFLQIVFLQLIRTSRPVFSM